MFTYRFNYFFINNGYNKNGLKSIIKILIFTIKYYKIVLRGENMIITTNIAKHILKS